MSTAVEVVLTELEAAEFRKIEVPLHVAGAEFDFEAAWIGSGVSHDLVLVATAGTSHDRLVRLTAGLSRALDHLESRRPVTLIVVGEALPSPVRDEVERHTRLLLVDGGATDASEVRRAISVLMPLTLPASADGGKDPIGEVVSALGAAISPEHLTLIQAAQGGVGEVRAALKAYIDDAFDGDLYEVADQ